MVRLCIKWSCTVMSELYFVPKGFSVENYRKYWGCLPRKILTNRSSTFEILINWDCMRIRYRNAEVSNEEISRRWWVIVSLLIHKYVINNTIIWRLLNSGSPLIQKILFWSFFFSMQQQRNYRYKHLQWVHCLRFEGMCQVS